MAFRPGLLLFFCFATGWGMGLRPQHDFYLSLTELTYDAEWGCFEGKVKIFSDNLHDALQQEGLIDGGLIFSEEKVQSLSVLARYLGRHLDFRAAGRPLPIWLTGVEVLGDAHWIEVEIGQTCLDEPLFVENRILLDHIDEQVNILRIRRLGEEYMKSFNRRLARGTIRW
ncbi:MAG: DUF6702 family protein [Bacteroidota bacterium]